MVFSFSFQVMLKKLVVSVKLFLLVTTLQHVINCIKPQGHNEDISKPKLFVTNNLRKINQKSPTVHDEPMCLNTLSQRWMLELLHSFSILFAKVCSCLIPGLSLYHSCFIVFKTTLCNSVLFQNSSDLSMSNENTLYAMQVHLYIIP